MCLEPWRSTHARHAEKASRSMRARHAALARAVWNRFMTTSAWTSHHAANTLDSLARDRLACAVASTRAFSARDWRAAATPAAQRTSVLAARHLSACETASRTLDRFTALRMASTCHPSSARDSSRRLHARAPRAALARSSAAAGRNSRAQVASATDKRRWFRCWTAARQAASFAARRATACDKAVKPSDSRRRYLCRTAALRACSLAVL
mmetsp:Transcript_10863/g.23394  ORF Transcript_10863/g.23394 Transcript_10863/m.23394 type:complete len:210 (-) Transcript_10863:256-885(-)